MNESLNVVELGHDYESLSRIVNQENSQATTQYALFPLPPSSALVGISLEPETEAKKMARVAKESMRVISGECREQ